MKSQTATADLFEYLGISSGNCPKADPVTGMWQQEKGDILFQIDLVSVVEGLEKTIPGTIMKKVYKDLAQGGYDIPKIKAHRLTLGGAA